VGQRGGERKEGDLAFNIAKSGDQDKRGGKIGSHSPEGGEKVR